MDGLPWPVIGASSGGWVIAGWFVWALLTGRLVSKREAEVYLTRAEKAEARDEERSTQMSELMTFAQLGQATFTALRERAEEPSP